MQQHDFKAFCQLIDAVYELREKTLTPKARTLFFASLQPYSIEAIQDAVHAHMGDPKAGKFLPMPADIIAKIEAHQGGDGRPGPEEAWAIALTSEDEAETVVWTQEIAEAFAATKPVIESCGAMSARKTFIEIYERLVAAARSRSIPVSWTHSLGWDLTRREAALTKAVSVGLLTAPVVAGLLLPPTGEVHGDANARAQIQKIREMMATMQTEKQRESELHAQRERDATAEAKARANQAVANYKADDAA